MEKAALGVVKPGTVLEMWSGVARSNRAARWSATAWQTLLKTQAEME